MTFNSLDEMIAYIEKASLKSNEKSSDDIVDILKTEIKKQVKGWEGYLFDAPSSVNVSKDNIEAEVSDNQGWTSLITGKDFKNVLYGLEEGYTWNREESDIMDKATEEAKKTVPDNWRKYMNSLGVPVK